MLHSLKMFNTGQITLPKSWRSKYDTQNFIAEETPEGLLITPLTTKESESAYYENGEGFGIYFPEGNSPEVVIYKIKNLQNDQVIAGFVQKLATEEKKKLLVLLQAISSKERKKYPYSPVLELPHHFKISQ